jgi:hypothetical protein
MADNVLMVVGKNSVLKIIERDLQFFYIVQILKVGVII